MLEIRAFGTLSIRNTVDQADIAGILSRPKRAALLTYLACARPYGFRRRDELFGLFWPDLPQVNARKALNQSVYILRRLVGHELIVSRRGEEIGLDRSAVWSDAASFHEAVTRGELPEALELYRGELLTAFHLADNLPFERWLDEEREHYRRRAIEVAVKQAEADAASGEAILAADRLRWALERSPFDEALLARLIRLLSGAGDDTGAHHELERFATRFDAELGIELSAATRALVAPRTVSTKPVRHDPEAPSQPIRGPVESEAGATQSTAKQAVRTARSGRRSRHPFMRWIGAMAIAAGMVAVTLFQANRSDGSAGPAALDPVRVLVAPLENLTGSEDLDPLGRIAADWVGRGLIGTGLVEVVPISSLDDVERTGGASGVTELVFSGSFHREGERLVVEARIIDGDTRAVVRSLDAIDAVAGTPLAAFEQLRQRATGALATLVDPRFADWADDASQPPSFETYLLYADGMERLERGDYAGAGERFLAAASRDSSFTSAHLWAIQSYSLVGEGPRDSLALALEPRRDRLPAWDRAMLDFHLADLRRDIYGAYRAMQRIVALSPTPQWRILLAQQARRLNRQFEALHVLDGIEPEQVTGLPATLPWIVLANTHHAVGEYEVELELARRWAAESPVLARRFEFNALAGLGRGDEVVDRILELSREWNWNYDRAEMLRRTALELRAHGQMDEARAVLERSFDLYELADDSVRLDPDSRFVIGRSLYAADRWDESRAVFTRLLDEGFRAEVVRGDIGIASARLGDRETAEDLIDWYTEWASTRPGQGGWATQWRARIAAALGDRDEAVRWFRQALAEGWSFTVWDHRTEEYENLRGYEPFVQLMRPPG